MPALRFVFTARLEGDEPGLHLTANSPEVLEKLIADRLPSVQPGSVKVTVERHTIHRLSFTVEPGVPFANHAWMLTRDAEDGGPTEGEWG